MPYKRDIGGMAKQSLVATEMADEMQAQAVAYIYDQFANPEEDSFSIVDMDVNELVARIDEARANGTMEELNIQLAQQLAQVFQQAGQQQQGQAQ